MTRDLSNKSEPGSDKAAARSMLKRSTGQAGRFSTWMRSIWRQRWLSLLCAWAVCMAGWLAIALWPSHYMSSAVVYADLHRLIAETSETGHETSDDLSDQGPVDLLKTVLLSDQNLADVRESAKLDDHDAETLATDVTLRATAPTLFVASYDHNDPTVAHSVLEKLFSNLNDQLEQTASEDTALSDQEIADLEKRFENATTNLLDFEQTNADLFGEVATGIDDIDAFEQELSELQEQIEDAIIERDEVAQQLAQIPVGQQAPNDPVPINVVTESQEAELELLETKLGELRERYADTHPYVSTVVKSIDAIKAGKDVDEQSTTENQDEIDESQLNNLQQRHEEKIAKVSQLNNDLANKQREIDRLSALTETVSSAEAERSILTEEKKDLETELADLVSRRKQAEQLSGAQNVQQDANKEQSSFRLINAPNLPEKPTGLSRLMCLALVLLGGIFIGGFVAVVRNQSKGVFESAWQLKQRFDVGVLGTISEVLTPAEQKKLGYSRLVFGLGCIGLVTVFSGLAIAEFLNLLTPWGDSLRTQLLG